MMATAAEDSERYVLILGFLGIAVLGLAGGAIGFVIALSANLRVKDIQSKLADEIRSSEERMRVAHEGTGAGTWEYVASTGELIWSKELFRLYGRSPAARSEEHTSELQSLMRTSYAVFCCTK